MMNLIADWAFTEFPASSRGGAKADTPMTPGNTAITPPPTPLLAGIFELCRQIRDGQFYTQGSTNLLGYPEFHNSAYDLLTLLENRALLQDALEGPENQTLNIKIGKENHLAQLENSTVLVARYNVGQDNTGVIGVIGPVRMDYSKLIPHLEYFAKTLGNLLSDTINPAQE